MRERIMKRTVACLVLVLMLCFSLAACQNSPESGQGDKAAKETTQEAAAEKTFKSEDDLFQITADEEWKNARATLGIEDASLAISKNNEAYIALISEYKYNFSNVEDLSGYNEMVIKHLENNIDEDKASETEEVKLGDYDACKTEITGKVGGADCIYTAYCLETDECYAQFICWSTAKSQDKYAAEFDKIARSLTSAKQGFEEESDEDTDGSYY